MFDVLLPFSCVLEKRVGIKESPVTVSLLGFMVEITDVFLKEK